MSFSVIFSGAKKSRIKKRDQFCAAKVKAVVMFKAEHVFVDVPYGTQETLRI